MSYQSKPSGYKTSPPFSAIQRFLLDNNKNNFSIQTPKNNGQIVSEGSLLAYSSKHHNNFALPSGEIDNFNGYGDNVFSNGESDLNWMHMYPKILKSGVNKKSELLLPENSLWPENSSYFIRKGEWTDEEDRILIDLVMKFGEKKWAKIAKQMHWRAGKQCRERWYNHLRPDIKKDCWSEEEERMLIEAHMLVGNKWSKIAKLIPGRTENSIKNHWNATKRRQNSKRKCKREGQKAKSLLLEEYQIKIFSTVNSATSPAATTTPSGSIVTEDKTESLPSCLEDLSDSSIDDQSPLFIINQTYDDELNFMKNFFAKKNYQPSNDNHTIGVSSTEGVKMDRNVSAYNEEGRNVFSNSFINSPEEDQLPSQTHLPSAGYISYVLDGHTNSSPYMNGYYGDLANADFMGCQASSSSSNGKKDMDLMEMLASTLGGNINFKL